mgnify:CR=1 FL=1
MKKSALIGTALLSAATVAAGIGMIALPHAYASWEEPLQQQLTSNILEQDTYYGSIEKDDSIYSYETYEKNCNSVGEYVEADFKVKTYEDGTKSYSLVSLQ